VATKWQEMVELFLVIIMMRIMTCDY
jgi:hypothetical protein